MCARRLFASEVGAEDAHLAVGRFVGVGGPHLDRTPVVPAPLAEELQAVVTSVALVATVGEYYSEADVGARTSSFRDLR